MPESLHPLGFAAFWCSMLQGVILRHPPITLSLVTQPLDASRVLHSLFRNFQSKWGKDSFVNSSKWLQNYCKRPQIPCFFYEVNIYGPFERVEGLPSVETHQKLTSPSKRDGFYILWASIRSQFLEKLDLFISTADVLCTLKGLHHTVRMSNTHLFQKEFDSSNSCWRAAWIHGEQMIPTADSHKYHAWFVNQPWSQHQHMWRICYLRRRRERKLATRDSEELKPKVIQIILFLLLPQFSHTVRGWRFHNICFSPLMAYCHPFGSCIPKKKLEKVAELTLFCSKQKWSQNKAW